MNYLDTSVVVPIYWPEAFSDAIELVLTDADNLMISHLVMTEFSSALAQKQRLSQCSIEQAAMVNRAFKKDITDGIFTIVPSDKAHWQRAINLLRDHGTHLPLRTLDVLHVAMAQDHECRLITADQRQYDLTQRIGMAATLIQHGTVG